MHNIAFHEYQIHLLALVTLISIFLLILSLYSLYISILNKSLKKFKETFIPYLIYMHMYIGVESLITILTPFNCISLFGLPNQMLYYDHHIQCWDSEHMKWTLGLSLPLLIIWIIMLPLASGLKLYFNIEAIHRQDKDFKLIYGSLYEPYIESCLYWEYLLYLCRIFGGIIVTITARLTEGINGLLLITAFIVMYNKQKYEMPYKRNILYIW